jgi:hypothetical protein
MIQQARRRTILLQENNKGYLGLDPVHNSHTEKAAR